MIPAHIEERIVRLHFVEKWPVGTIAKQVGVHHSTVKRVLRSKGVPVALTARPSMVEPFLPFIRETLEAYPKLPSSRLHEMVVERGYPGSRSHFRRLVATLRPRKPAEAYQRLSTLSGEEAQVDWASFGTRVVGRATRRVSAFVMVLSWSRMPFVRFSTTSAWAPSSRATSVPSTPSAVSRPWQRRRGGVRDSLRRRVPRVPPARPWDTLPVLISGLLPVDERGTSSGQAGGTRQGGERALAGACCQRPVAAGGGPCGRTLWASAGRGSELGVSVSCHVSRNYRAAPRS